MSCSGMVTNLYSLTCLSCLSSTDHDVTHHLRCPEGWFVEDAVSDGTLQSIEKKPWGCGEGGKERGREGERERDKDRVCLASVLLNH